MKIVQIKGSNGSGKTTIVKQMLEWDDNTEYLTDQKGKCYATVMHDLGWIALGKYDLDKAMGGVDSSLSTVDEVKLAISTAAQYGLIKDYFGVVFEGMMISTIKSTFYDYLLGLEKLYNGEVEPLFVILEAVPSGCIERMEARGTKKANLKFQNIVDKCTMVIKHAATYDQKYVRWMNVERIGEYSMLRRFLELVGDDELLDLLYPFRLEEVE